MNRKNLQCHDRQKVVEKKIPTPDRNANAKATETHSRVLEKEC